MRIQFRLLTAVSLLILACPSPAAADDIVDAINPTAMPNGGTYNTYDAGWVYTPAFSYILDGIGALFATSDGRMVTAEIFSGTPGSMTLLGAGGFTPVANSFADAAMAPIFLTAGATYFVALEGIHGLGSNLTVTGTDVESLVWYQEGDRSFSSGPAGASFFGQPSGVEPKVFPKDPFIVRYLAVFTLWNIGVGSFNPFFYAYFARQLHLSTTQIGFHLLGLPNGRTRGSGGATHHSAIRRRIRHCAQAGRDRGFHGPARNRTLRPIRRHRLRDVRIVSVHERAGNLHTADVSRHAWRARGSILSQLLRHVRRHPLRDRAVLIFAAFSTVLPVILFRMLR
jgi:hypothetical protein